MPCQKCKNMHSPFECRQTGKDTFVCLPCQRTDGCCARRLGSLKFLKRFTSEDAEAFYRSCKELTPDQIEALAVKNFQKYTREEDYFEEGGQFLPLSVWATLGAQ